MTPNLPKQPPEAIAEDVLAAARKAVVSVNPDERVLIMSGHYDDWDTVQSAVAAIMADRLTQRERYAKLADLHDFRPLAKLIRAGA